MKLRYLVPALGVFASLNTISAETVGGLTVGGYVDAIAQVSNVADDAEKAEKDFTAFVELRVGYKVGENVTAQIDLEFDGEAGSSSNLEAGYINWAITDAFSLTAGKFMTYSGWVAADADGLYRINGGPITAIYGGSIIGTAGNFTVSDDFSISVFLVNGLDVYTPGTTNGTDGLALGVDAVYNVEGLGSFNFEVGYDYSDADFSELSLAVNATLTPAEPLTIGAEIMYRSQDNDGDAENWLGLLGMANYKLGTETPMSVTGMLQYLMLDEPDTSEESSSIIEIAAALLTNPTKDPNFGVNFEVAYYIAQDDGTFDAPFADILTPGEDDGTAIVVAAELLALIP